MSPRANSVRNDDAGLLEPVVLSTLSVPKRHCAEGRRTDRRGSPPRWSRGAKISRGWTWTQGSTCSTWAERGSPAEGNALPGAAPGSSRGRRARGHHHLCRRDVSAVNEHSRVDEPRHPLAVVDVEAVVLKAPRLPHDDFGARQVQAERVTGPVVCQRKSSGPRIHSLPIVDSRPSRPARSCSIAAWCWSIAGMVAVTGYWGRRGSSKRGRRKQREEGQERRYASS